MPNQKADKEFLIKLEQLVQENLGNESFGVSELAKELGMSRSNLHRKVNAITEASVSQYIRQARLKAAKELLQKTTNTVSEVGYKVGFSSTSYFIKCFHDFYGYPPGQVEEVEEPEAEEEKTESVPEEKRKKKRNTIFISVLSVVVAAVVIVVLVISGVIEIGKKAGEIKSLVILPFDNYTNDENLDIVAAGMHSALITDMQERISGLRIPGKTSSNSFRNANFSVRHIASELKVQAAIEAELRHYGDSIEIHFRLIHVYPNEKQIWANTYKEDRSQLFNLYSRLTKNIADDLKIELSEKEEELLAETRTVHPDALEAYLKGLAQWEKLDLPSIQKAMSNFELATQLAPDWADPYAGLAMVWSTFGFFQVMPKSATQPNIDRYMTKALELNPNSAMAHYVNAIYLTWTEWEWEQGEKEFLKTLELNPNDALAHLYYAHLLMILHRNDEALEQANIGLGLDPLKPLVISLYAVVLQNEERYNEALIYLNKALSIDPNFVLAKGNMMRSLYLAGEYEKWIEAWESKVRMNGRWKDECIETVVDAFHEGGPEAAIEATFRMNEQYGNEGAFMSAGIKMERYLLLGDYEKALDLMERASETKNLSTAYWGTNLETNSKLKANHRYIELLEKMGLPLPPSD